jgi:pseudouridine synthase
MANLIRLNRFLALAGVASRRQADLLIAKGDVKVNGTTVSNPGMKVDPQADAVDVRGRRAALPAQHTYVLYHKPSGCLCTAADPHGGRTIYDLLPAGFRRLKYAGRLDYDSEGLLVLTDDGDFIQMLTHPRYGVLREYEALVRGVPSRESLARLAQGIEVDGERYRSLRARVLAEADPARRGCLVGIAALEGRKREIRRAFSALGHPVLRLRRTSFGPLSLGDLAPGRWRNISRGELRACRALWSRRLLPDGGSLTPPPGAKDSRWRIRPRR